jgi:hypothetical protein
MADAKKVPRTVGELIEQLSKLDPNLFVETEGCDCVGPWSGDVSVHDNAVTIGRNDNRPDWKDWP